MKEMSHTRGIGSDLKNLLKGIENKWCWVKKE
jgi:hypothetical protein